MYTWESTRTGGTAATSSDSSVSSESYTLSSSYLTTAWSGPSTAPTLLEIHATHTDTASFGGTTTDSCAFLGDDAGNIKSTAGSTYTYSGSGAGQSTSMFPTQTTTVSSSTSHSEEGGTTVSGQTTTVTGSINSYPGTSSVSTVSSYPASFSYNSSTTTTATTVTATVSTSTAETYGYPISTTASSTETTTGIPTTTSYTFLTTTTATSSNSEATSGTTTWTTSTWTNVTGTANIPCYLDTVVVAETTDWLWQVTNTKTGDPTGNGASFTKATFSESLASLSVEVGLIPVTATATGAITYSTWSTDTSSMTSTAETSSSSTYAVGAVPTTSTLSSYGTATVTTTLSAALPLTSTSSATVTFTTSTADTLTYNTRATVGNTITTTAGGVSQTSSSTVTESDTTTFALGTITTSFSYTIPVQNTYFYTGTQGIGVGITGFTSGTGTVHSGTFTSTYTTYSGGGGGLGASGGSYTVVSASTTLTTTAAINESSSAMLYVTDTTIGPGWQPTPSSFGSDEPVGTNISGPSFITQQALGYPSVSVGVPASTDPAFSIAGAVNTTLINQVTQQAWGGFDWVSTISTVGTQTVGILRITTCDSFSNTSTSETTFDTSHSTYSIASGQGAAAETVPVVYSTSTDGNAIPVLTFSAFPSS